MTIYSGLSHWKWWFSIVMLVYQRLIYPISILSHVPSTLRAPLNPASVVSCFSGCNGWPRGGSGGPRWNHGEVEMDSCYNACFIYTIYIYIIISVVIIMIIIIIIILFWLLSTLLLLYYCFSSGISDSWTNKHCGFIWFMSHCCLGWWVSPLMANKTGPRGYMSYERVKPWCLNGTWMTTDLEMFWSKAVVRGEWHSYELLILTIW